VAAGAAHSLAVGRDDGALWTFGLGVMHQLGHGGKQDERTPRKVAALEGVRLVRVAGGAHHSLAVDDEGACYSWGAGEARERTSTWVGGWLGHRSLDEQPTPLRISALAGIRVVAVAAGSRHSLVLADGGHVYSFGDGGHGKLGHCDGGRMHWVPARVMALKPSACVRSVQRVAAIAAGEEHSLCRLRDGRVLGWGAAGAVGLAPQDLTDRADEQPASWGSAGNYEWAPGDALRRWQAHTPTPLATLGPPVEPESEIDLQTRTLWYSATTEAEQRLTVNGS